MSLPKNFYAISLYVTWVVLSAIYYTVVHIPPDINIIANMIALFTATFAVAALPDRQYLTKIYIVSFASAVGLASLQISRTQPDFTFDFLLFTLIHLVILGAVIAMAPPSGTITPATRMGANLALYLFLALAAYVLATKGTRLGDFMDGVKKSGDIYKISGISGIQGIISVFLFCCFGYLTRTNKIIFIAAVCIIAVLDVKRGEIVRLAIFLFFYMWFWTATVSTAKWRVLLPIAAAAAIAVFIVGGQIRQNLYSQDFSISDVLDSRVRSTSIDWLYGYVGINVSVLQTTFESEDEHPGYFETVTDKEARQDLSAAPARGINGFNANTVFGTFAGENRILPSLDFLFFCMVVVSMVYATRLFPLNSLKAFMALQIFGFVFGNQLILPHYIAGFMFAVLYISSFSIGASLKEKLARSKYPRAAPKIKT